ncbi:proline--tRNA ligase [Candidatus Woesearchaeota archaeon CG10_big_fil_rev_8_21_14_0_10_34_12]|nr:MAG: proline--tRNA ligase [Candidatus Woesearchaeota archaeon CG10_big_fil_rev_8_21_14_0_10_34_12]
MTKSKKEKGELGISAEKDEFSEWFSQLMLKADLADYTDVSGCMVFKPGSYAIWEKVKEEIDKRFKKLGVQNTYFPLLIPEKFLNKEKEHVEGFSPEVAWVTEAGNTKLSEKLAVRPTSETIMYPSYSKWIRSWRDLPLRYNQWNNVVRWEFKHPVPFFRTREFLWNELHTVLATEKEAMEEGKEILNAYQDFCENCMALYGLAGRKTEKEKFAGGVASYKLHYVLSSGRVIEGPCFHYDGNNFARAYDIKFLDESGKEKYVYQNTYAISTRMLGAMFAIHSDDLGLILPPKIAPNKIVIVPIIFEDSKNKVIKKAREIEKQLEEFGAFVDERDNYKPGFKFNEWELKGIPLRLEIGPKDIEKNQVITTRRDTGKKETIRINDLKKQLPKILDDIQKSMFKKSEKAFKEKIEKTATIQGLIKIVNNKKVGIAPLCSYSACEDMMKSKTSGAKALFIAKDKVKNEKCIICGRPAAYFVYAGKSY